MYLARITFHAAAPPEVSQTIFVSDATQRSASLRDEHGDLKPRRGAALVVVALADLLTDIVTDAVLAIAAGKDKKDIDLHMVEIMCMQHRSANESRLVRGIVLDHGGRHPDMKKELKKQLQARYLAPQGAGEPQAAVDFLFKKLRF